VLFLHIVALANVVGVRQPPLTTLKDPLRMLGHVAVNALATPCTLLVALVAKWDFVVLLRPPKDPIRLSPQLALVGFLRSIRNTLLVALAAGALAVVSRFHSRRGML
jgi:hypothetical protein